MRLNRGTASHPRPCHEQFHRALNRTILDTTAGLAPEFEPLLRKVVSTEMQTRYSSGLSRLCI